MQTTLQMKYKFPKLFLYLLASSLMIGVCQASPLVEHVSIDTYVPVYFLYLLVFFVVPVCVLAWLLRAQVKTYRRTLLWTLLFIYTFGALWDWLSVQTGLWNYDTADSLGVWILGLPIEEFVGFYVFGTMLIALVALYFLRKESHV